jgi:hypothetical protein
MIKRKERNFRVIFLYGMCLTGQTKIDKEKLIVGQQNDK